MTNQARLQNKEYCILHIEDNLGDVFLLRESLEAHSLPIMLNNVCDGQEALDLIFNDSFEKPDLFIIDINLPRIDGITILKKIKHSEKYKNIPVIIFSSSDSEVDIQQTYSIGADLYLIKPMDWDHYTSIVDSIIKFLV